MRILRPKSAILGGAALGIVAGAAVYGAVSSASLLSAPLTFEQVQAKVGTASVVTPAPIAVPAAVPSPARAAGCAPGQSLEDGVCIVRVERIVVRPAPATQREVTASALGSSSKPDDHASESREREKAEAPPEDAQSSGEDATVNTEQESDAKSSSEDS